MFARLLLLTLFVGACSSGPVVEEQVSSSDEKPMPEKKVKDNWSWSYSNDGRGPSQWGQINPDYQACSSGLMQSPINLVWHKPSSPNPLKMNYKAGMAKQLITPNTIRLDLTPQSFISFKDSEYLLEKIELRSPSEHQLSGNSLPMELQFYHRSSNGLKQAIISLFVVYGKKASWFDKFWDSVQGEKKMGAVAEFSFNPNQLIPPRKTYYHYQGSLTHPPCLEGVQWLVFNTPLQLSREQVQKFQNYFGKNNRPVQPLNDRKVQNY